MNTSSRRAVLGVLLVAPVAIAAAACRRRALEPWQAVDPAFRGCQGP